MWSNLLIQKITFSFLGIRIFEEWRLNLCLKKLFIILIKDPSKIRNRIEQNKIEMLKPMVLPYGLVVMDAHEFDLDIMVLAIYIGIGMMCNVVLQLPKVNIASQKVQGV